VYITDNNSVIRRIADGRITTIAGTGVEGYSGDGGKAIDAMLLSPKGIAIAKDGSIIFADASNNRIRRITPETELIETIAGTGEAGYTGDGGAAHLATLSNPHGIAVDAAGNIYVAEAGNSVVRVIKPAN
jgi:DNA-binding beta-propeller fold protein YncE